MAEAWVFRSDTLARYGRASKPLNVIPDPGGGGNTRDDLVYGQYKPDATTTGVLAGTVLTDYADTNVNTNTYTFPGATTVVGKRIYGDLRPPTNGAEVILENCLLVGGNHTPSTQSAVVDCNSGRPGTTRITLRDCTILPRKPSLNRDCIVGHKYNIYRCNLSESVDGAGIFITNANGTSASVRMYGCYVHDLVYFYPDYSNGVSGATVHTDGTHNDGIQIQGGNNIHVWGNNLLASSFLGVGSGANPQKPWLLSGSTKWINGATIIVQKQSVTAALDATVVIEENWIAGGLSSVNMKPGTYTVQNNRLMRSTAIGPSWSGYWFRGDSKATTNPIGILTNRWDDTNALIAEPRASGIHWNA